MAQPARAARAPSTYEREEQSLRRFRAFSHHYVEEITPARVEEIVMTGGTRQGQIALRLIKRVLGDARARGQRARGCVHDPVSAPRVSRSEVPHLGGGRGAGELLP